jgi:hypothetical protein
LLGLFAGYSRANGDIEGNLFGLFRLNVGDLGMDAYNIGGYWTHTWINGGYVDAVVMQSWLNANTSSIGGYSNKRDLTTLELGGGVSAQLNNQASVHAKAAYDLNLGGEDFHALEGNIGLRVSW